MQAAQTAARLREGELLAAVSAERELFVEARAAASRAEAQHAATAARLQDALLRCGALQGQLLDRASGAGDAPLPTDAAPGAATPAAAAGHKRPRCDVEHGDGDGGSVADSASTA